MILLKGLILVVFSKRLNNNPVNKDGEIILRFMNGKKNNPPLKPTHYPAVSRLPLILYIQIKLTTTNPILLNCTK